jgi:acetyl esterase/lipase
VTLHCILSLVVLALATTAARAADDVKILPDVVYGHKDGLALTFDVLTPPEPNGAGVLFMVSGGWYSNWAPPENMVAAQKHLLDAKFTLFIVRHGSAPKYTVPEAVDDVRRAVRFIRLHAADYGVDPARLGVWGGSAGGHLTLMLATTGDDGDPKAKDPLFRQSSRIACGVSLCPPTDLRQWTTNPPAAIAAHAGLKPPLAFDAAKEPDVSPIVHVTADDAPVLMIHGDKDSLVPIEHSCNILPVFEQAGVGSELLTVEGVDHGFSPESQQQIIRPGMVKWFEKHLLAP